MDYDIFCDESRHIERDKFQYMVLGAIWCERSAVHEINSLINNLKITSNFAGEIKWTNITRKKIDLFKNLIHLFFIDNRLSFRCIVIDKDKLKHALYNPTAGHEEFYYKMYYRLLVKKICSPNIYRIFLDYKGKDNSKKIKELQGILGHTFYDFSDTIVVLMQSVHSQHFPLLQLTDVLIGAIGYVWNSLDTSPAKLEICEVIRKFSGLSTLKISTSYSENKFEIFNISLR